MTARAAYPRQQTICGVGHMFHTGAVAQLCSRLGLLHDLVTSELACPDGRAGRMLLCPSRTPKSSTMTSCALREASGRGRKIITGEGS